MTVNVLNLFKYMTLYDLNFSVTFIKLSKTVIIDCIRFGFKKANIETAESILKRVFIKGCGKTV